MLIWFVVIYLLISLIIEWIAATLVDPKVFTEPLTKDSQLVLPTLILQHKP